MWSYPASSPASAWARADAVRHAPRVRVQRAAAALRARHVDVVALRGQHPRRRRVDIAEDDALHAARDERDTLAPAGGVLGRPLRRGPRRRDALERGERTGGRQPAQRERDPQAAAVGQHREQRAPHDAVAQRPSPALLDELARALDQAVVLHTRRAGGDARHAAQAAVEVLGDLVGQQDRAVLERAHQVDAPARRVHLLVPQHVGRAARQAEPAVHAVGDQLRVHIASTIRSASGLQRSLGRLRRVGDPRARAHERRILAGLPAPATGQRGLQRADLGPRVGLLAAQLVQLRRHGALGALDQHLQPSVHEVDGARHDLRAHAAPASACRRSRPCAPHAGSGCRRSATRSRLPSRPREPHSSFPRS